MGCGLDFGCDSLFTFRSAQKPQLKDLVNGCISHQRVQEAMKLFVKRLEILNEAIAFTLCRGWSVG
jgi:hypothetical protein